MPEEAIMKMPSLLHRRRFPPVLRIALSLLILASLTGGLQAQDFDDDDCMTCHDDLQVKGKDGIERNLTIDLAAHKRSAHGQGDMSCADCHLDIEKLPHTRKLMKVRCDACHRAERDVYRKGIHHLSRGPKGDGDGATCSDCHGVHDVLAASDPKSPIYHANLARTCIRCHEDQALIEQHEAMPEAKHIKTYSISVHGQSNTGDPTSRAATCSDCHGMHDTRPARSPESPVSRARVTRTCGKCHESVLQAYMGSVHGTLAEQGNPDVPVCIDCHGEHRIRSPDDRLSTVSRQNIAETCARCHEDPRITEKYDIPIAMPATLYRRSVHGRALLDEGREEAAACQDCHGHHSILGGSDANSRVHRQNIPKTCGACHQHADILSKYERSVHGVAMRRGIRESPVCTDCHGEHTILKHGDPDSPVYKTRLAKEVCGRCHDSLVLIRKYGMKSDKVSTFYESYHGLASKLGDTQSANCASCHGVHEILSREDERSSIHPDRLVETCGECHPGASAGFVSGLVHVSPASRENPLLWWLRRIYILLIVLTIGGMLLHNALIMVRHVRDKYRSQTKQPHVIRFPSAGLWQHLLISVFFIALVVSGFSLSYPESIFSRFMGTFLGFGETARSTVHRISGVGLMVTVIWHAIGILLTRRGRQELGALMPRIQDAKDAALNTKYHLGFTNERPQFDRYDYSEKMEYWALMWGVLVMVVSGLLMWFPAAAASFLGLDKIWFDAANVIHFYEAWLATLAIVVWHIFFVMFHPEEYPMALSWLTGKLPVESMEERHPRELERLKAEGSIVYPDDGNDTEDAKVDETSADS
jgi:cytochrome b subunit of formate dehydrogenase